MTRSFVRYGAFRPHSALTLFAVSHRPFRISASSGGPQLPVLHSPQQVGQSRQGSFPDSASQAFADGVVSDSAMSFESMWMLALEWSAKSRGVMAFRKRRLASIPVPGDW